MGATRGEVVGEVKAAAALGERGMAAAFFARPFLAGVGGREDVAVEGVEVGGLCREERRGVAGTAAEERRLDMEEVGKGGKGEGGRRRATQERGQRAAEEQKTGRREAVRAGEREAKEMRGDERRRAGLRGAFGPQHHHPLPPPPPPPSPPNTADYHGIHQTASQRHPPRFKSLQSACAGYHVMPLSAASGCRC